MQEVRRRRDVALLGLRARAPQVMRVLTLLASVCVVVFIAYSFYRSRNGNREFRLKSGKAELSSNVVRRVENYERVVNESNRVSMIVRAAVATSFDDGHHELSNVHIEYFKEGVPRPEKIDARTGVYFNETELVNFSGDVRIETDDQLKVNSESVSYDVKNQRAESQSPLTFARENVSGRADAATVDGKAKHLNLRGNVEIKVEPSADAKNPAANLRGKPVVVRAPRADFDQGRAHLAFTGGATAEQGRDVMSGDALAGFLNEQRRVQRIEARGNSYLRSSEEGRAAEVRSVNMDFFFDERQQLERAVASQNVQARTLDADSEAQLSAPAEAQVFFAAQQDRSVIKEMRAGGRPVVTLSAPRSQAANPRAANKRLTADSVNLYWRTQGRDLERAEAIGNAELLVEPARPWPAADRKQLFAPRFDCDFYDSGNVARQFTATGQAKAIITPIAPDERRGVRTLTSEKMIATFVRETQDMERIEAQGGAQFIEGDRNGQSDSITYTAADSTARLRGGEPVAWDARARLKASEIDTNAQTKITYARGRAQTTYYSQEQTGGAAPFAKVKSPVFVTSNEAEFRHEEGLGIYTGDARAWQDDNFVRAERIALRREAKRMEAEGHVQSALYRARRREANGGTVVVPVFATASRMFYSDTDRLLHYEGAVDIKQGTERVTAEAADVYLQKEQNEVERTIAQRNVVVTQPGKRGTGDRAEYNAAAETVELTGDPARVEDTEQGNSEGRRMTVYLRENRVVADSGATEAARPAGRVRSVHKIKKQ